GRQDLAPNRLGSMGVLARSWSNPTPSDTMGATRPRYRAPAAPSGVPLPMPASFVIDMDGVVYHGHRLIPGAREFVDRLRDGGHPFLFLTNNSQWTPRDLRHRLAQMGIDVDESAFHTSALATAEFLRSQRPGGSAFV